MLELLVFAFLTLIILKSNLEETIDLKKLTSIDLYLFILEVDGIRKEIYTFNQEIDDFLEQEQIILGINDYFKVEVIEGINHIKVIRSYKDNIIVEEKSSDILKDFAASASGGCLFLHKNRQGRK